LDILTGKVIGDCRNRHTSAEYIAFLKTLDKKCLKEKTLHIVADNYSTHKTDEVQKYLKTREGRFVLHFIPTHSSWLNQIERWFAELTNKRIRRESWSSVGELTVAIKEYIIGWNKNSKPFKWTKSTSDILCSIEKTKT
jgi:transposase